MGGIGLASTLIVVEKAMNNAPVTRPFPVFNWENGSFADLTVPANANTPLPDLLQITTKVAVNMEVLEFVSPDPNSTYTFELRGPYAE